MNGSRPRESAVRPSGPYDSAHWLCPQPFRSASPDHAGSPSAPCAHIAAAGYVPLIYANPDWLLNYMYQDQLAADVWLAHYTEVGGKTWYTGPWAIHQYSETGRVAGIKTAVDLDVSRVDYGAQKIVDEENVPDAWAREAWDWCKLRGYMDGTRPREAVTREMLAVVLHRVETDMD